ncbi:U4/U5/U6 small nuclear ribonucleoprotein prp3 [Microbotryomycetes sp. JL221]|nr:U4/U5/U6 small nuclear ribonucleoprotein prp3 [Microbotryomycetes sp. JL221]
MSDRKRGMNVFGEPDDDEASPKPKKLKPTNKAAPSFLPPHMSAATAVVAPPKTPQTPSAIPMTIDLAAKRAEIMAKLAQMKQGKPNSAPAPLPPSSAPPPTPPSATATTTPTPTPSLDPDLAKKVAEARRLVESMQAKKRAMTTVNPYLSHPLQNKRDANAAALDPSVAGRGGLTTAAHPLLMDTSLPTAQSKKDRYKPMAPKFSTTKANSRMPAPTPKPNLPVNSTSSNTKDDNSIVDTPFFDPRLGYGSAGATGKTHMGRGHERSSLKFNTKGKFVKLGEQMRAEARMEELKKRILETARKAGLENEMEDQAKLVKRPPPPDIEWWDAPFVSGEHYEDFDSEKLKSSDQITIYIQHPIQIPSPQDKIKIESKPLFLTKKEMKKMRRQRRMAELRDKQDRIKLGLLPPDPPKVKLSNMMRVLTNEAVNDPTKVEARVKREMIARERGHLKMNQERKLTNEEKKLKIESKYEQDASKGIGVLCFKVKYLTNPSHKFKVKKNAIDNHLTGVICHNPKFCLIVVEGGQKALKHYRNLMLNRINWTEEAQPRTGAVVNEVEETNDDNKVGHQDSSLESVADVKDGQPSTTTTTTTGFDTSLEEPQSLADNYCQLVWQGQHRERLFNTIRNANCPSDASVKEVLGSKLEGLWDMAKVEVKEED